MYRSALATEPGADRPGRASLARERRGRFSVLAKDVPTVEMVVTGEDDVVMLASKIGDEVDDPACRVFAVDFLCQVARSQSVLARVGERSKHYLGCPMSRVANPIALKGSTWRKNGDRRRWSGSRERRAGLGRSRF